LSILGVTGGSYENLSISHKARLVLPQHIALDRVKEASSGKGQKLGTTGRGMGPAYVDHVARLGLVVNDLLNPDVFVRKLRRNLEDKVRLLRTYDPDVVRAVMHQPILKRGAFYVEDDFFDVDAMAEIYLDFGKVLRRHIRDTDALVRDALASGKRVLLEGAQGNLLSVDYGTYPYVTSSDCSIQGLAKGVGLRDGDIDLPLGIVKAFYMTRVGEGPFPTELGGGRSAEWCGHGKTPDDRPVNRESERDLYPDASVNSADEFEQGIGMRLVGREYGATTGRPRRTGWLDLPLLRYSSRFAGKNTVLTKLDVLDDAETVKICTSYHYRGPEYAVGDRTIRGGDFLDVAIAEDLEVMCRCEPVYREFPGWRTRIRDIRRYEDLPRELRELIRFVESETDTRTLVVSVGPDRDETIEVSNLGR
jgi:adenylosuccinate synthase